MRSTAPTTSSRRSCSNSCPTSRSPFPSAARSRAERAGRGPDLEPHARTARGAAPPLRLPLDRLSRRRRARRAIIMLRAGDVARSDGARRGRRRSRGLRRCRWPSRPASPRRSNGRTPRPCSKRAAAPWPEAFRRAIGVLIKDEEDLRLIAPSSAHPRGGARHDALAAAAALPGRLSRGSCAARLPGRAGADRRPSCSAVTLLGPAHGRHPRSRRLRRWRRRPTARRVRRAVPRLFCGEATAARARRRATRRPASRTTAPRSDEGEQTPMARPAGSERGRASARRNDASTRAFRSAIAMRWPRFAASLPIACPPRRSSAACARMRAARSTCAARCANRRADGDDAVAAAAPPAGTCRAGCCC